jgi:hypothetical protein
MAEAGLTGVRGPRPTGAGQGISQGGLVTLDAYHQRQSGRRQRGQPRGGLTHVDSRPGGKIMHRYPAHLGKQGEQAGVNGVGHCHNTERYSATTSAVGTTDRSDSHSATTPIPANRQGSGDRLALLTQDRQFWKFDPPGGGRISKTRDLAQTLQVFDQANHHDNARNPGPIGIPNDGRRRGRRIHTGQESSPRLRQVRHDRRNWDIDPRQRGRCSISDDHGHDATGQHDRLAAMIVVWLR